MEKVLRLNKVVTDHWSLVRVLLGVLTDHWSGWSGWMGWSGWLVRRAHRLYSHVIQKKIRLRHVHHHMVSFVYLVMEAVWCQLKVVV